MATYEKNGQLTYVDENGNEYLLYPQTKQECVDGLPEALGGKAPASHVEDTNNPHNVTADQVGARPDNWMPTAEEVGARPDTWLPSTAEVGAAPAGFGLGDGAPVCEIEDIDNMDSCGWFYAIASGGYKVSGKTLHYLFVRVDSWKNSAGSRRVMQTAYNDGRVLQRWQKHDGTWNEWEWVNPPMESGVEYCTTERWKEKSVYTKLINCGTLASGRNVIAHNLAAEIIRYGGSCDKNALPYIDPNNNGEVNIAVSSNNIILNATSQFAGEKAYIQLWYVKG